ncbi:MAG: transporter substrate-binding domain-containing protein [Ruminiclostridium sp.]|nr:transporter substrate-binding domain-containing protein [Ruminiclostridium sp.]
MQLAIDNGLKGVTLIDEDLGDVSEVSVGVSRAARVPDLRIKLNSFISEMNAAGILDDAFDRWSNDGNYEMPDIPKADAPGFTLRVGTTGIVEPYSFYEGKTLTGFDIEMARRFAAWLGADIEFTVYDYSGVIAAAESGDIDCIFADLMVTDERREAIDFSDPLFLIKK